MVSIPLLNLQTNWTIVMEVAALLAVGLGDWIDFGVILGILFLNAFVGFYQEKQAADVVASLKGDIAMRCTVIRDGQEQNILARELVPGDIVSNKFRLSWVSFRSLLINTKVFVEEGGTVPADVQLICDYGHPEHFETFKILKAEEGFENNGSDNDEEDHEGLERDNQQSEGINGGTEHRNHPLIAVDQSAITGESLAVDKYMGDIVYYTTSCQRRKAYAIVQTSAKFSFVGRTANLVQGAKDQGHFKAVMNNIGTALLVLVMFWILVAWIGGFFHHIKIALPGDQNLLHYALVLLIIGVPVGLPVVTTTTLAVGAAYLAEQKAIVQKLTAIESLAVRLRAADNHRSC